MKYRRKFEFSPKLLLIFLTVVCALLLTVSVMFRDVAKPFTNVVGMVIIPMQNGINRVGGWAGDTFGDFKSLKELRQENEELKAEIEKLNEANKRLNGSKEELAQAENLLDLKDNYKDYNTIGARVISKGSGNWYQTLVINKGTKDGIKKDMNVLADGGLAGIITDVGINYAKVRTIIDDDSSVSAMSEKSRNLCVVKGNSESIKENGMIDVKYISKDAEMHEGERLTTSHISSKYVPGLLIGNIQNIAMDPSNLTQSAVVVPEVDFQLIEKVLVITDLKIVPSDSDSAD